MSLTNKVGHGWVYITKGVCHHLKVVRKIKIKTELQSHKLGLHFTGRGVFSVKLLSEIFKQKLLPG